MKVHSFESYTGEESNLLFVILLLHVKLLWQQFSNDNVIYDLKGLNQNGSYSLRLKYSTITLLGHSRVSVPMSLWPNSLDDAVCIWRWVVYSGQTSTTTKKHKQERAIGKAIHCSFKILLWGGHFMWSMRGNSDDWILFLKELKSLVSLHVS